MRKVVITAAGAISGNGNTLAEIYTNMLQGTAARTKIWHFPIDDPKYARSCSTKEGLIDVVCGSTLTNEKLFDLSGFEGRVHRFDRHQLFALVVARQTLKPFLAHGYIEDVERFGIVGGTGNGGLNETYPATLRLEAGDKLDPFSNIRELPNTFVGMIANYWGIKGPSDVGVTACAASTNGLINAVRTIKLDEADMMLVIGTEAVINPFGIASFASQRALSNKSRPYQKDRLGFLMGEGAAAILLESEGHARGRGATILAEVVGYGSTTDGNSEGAITSPDPSGGARAAMLALKMAGIGPENLAYINTHGTGTPDGDKAELEGIKSWAGDWAKKIFISSTKSFSGHLLGAAGAFELALCVMMLEKGYLLPTWGLTKENMDPEFADFNHVTRTVPLAGAQYVLSNSFGFGGANASVLLKRYIP